MKTHTKTLYGISFVALAALTVFAMGGAVVADEPELTGIINPPGGITNNCDRVAQGYCDEVAAEAIEFMDKFYEADLNEEVYERRYELFQDDDTELFLTTPDPENPEKVIFSAYYGFEEVTGLVLQFQSVNDGISMEFDTRYVHVIDDNSASHVADMKASFITLVPLPGIPVGTHGVIHATQLMTLEKTAGEWKVESSRIHIATEFDL